MVPEAFRAEYRPLLLPDESDHLHWALVQAADKLSAYAKCLEEAAAGNPEFAKAEKALRATVEAIDLPEVRYFLDVFTPSFRLTLDELG